MEPLKKKRFTGRTATAIIPKSPDKILLVKRLTKPFIGYWALPGGRLDPGETVEETVIREAKEETGLDIRNLWLVGVYSDPARDPRFHTVSIVFSATADGKPVGMDDACEAQVFSEDSLPFPIVFDHAGIIADFLAREGESR